MEILYIFGAVLIVGLFYIVPILYQNSRLNDKYKSIAEQLEIDFKKRIGLIRPQLKGYYKDYYIHLASFYSNPMAKYDQKLVIQTTMKFNLPFHFRITKDRASFLIGKFLSERDIEIGDDQIDTKYFIEGGKLTIYMILTQELRKLLEMLYVGTEMFDIHDDGISIQFPEKSPQSANRIIRTIKDMAEIVNRLKNGKELTQILLDNLAIENNINTICEIIKSLKSKKDSRQINKKAILNFLLQHKSFEVRAHAAGGMGDEGFNLLFQLYTAERTTEEKIILIQELSIFDIMKVEKLLIEQLSDKEDDIVIAVIEALAKFPKETVFRELNKILNDNSITDKIKKCAKKSAKQIAQYLDITDKGWLSVLETDESGALSMGEEE